MENPLCKDRIPAPVKARIAPATLFSSTFFLSKRKAIKGTITTLVAVKKAFLEAVVYCRPTICSAKPENNAAPSRKPQRISSFVIVFISFLASIPMQNAPIRKRKNMI